MKPYTSALLAHQIWYSWGFPFKLSFFYKGRTHTLTSPDEAQAILESLYLLPSISENRSPADSAPSRPALNPPGAPGKQRKATSSPVHAPLPQLAPNALT